MHGYYYHKFFRVFKTIGVIAALVLSCFFIGTFFVAYFYLSYSDRNVDAENTQLNHQILTIINTQNPNSKNDKENQFVDNEYNATLSAKNETARDLSVRKRIIFLKEIVSLRADPRLEMAPPLCEIICHQSSWNKKKEHGDIWERLNSFLEEEGSRAFEDPKFRLFFELTSAYADPLLITTETLETLEPILKRNKELSEYEKVYWSAYAPIYLANLVAKTSEVWPSSQRKIKAINKILDLSNQCGGRPAEDIENACETLIQDK